MPLRNLIFSALCLSKTLDNFFRVQHHCSSPSLPKLPVSRPQVVYFWMLTGLPIYPFWNLRHGLILILSLFLWPSKRRENMGFSETTMPPPPLLQNMRCGLGGDFLVSMWETRKRRKGGEMKEVGRNFQHLVTRWSESLVSLPLRRGMQGIRAHLLCPDYFL